MKEAEENVNMAAQLVRAFITAINAEDFETAQGYANDDFIFEGVLGSRHGAEAYFKDMAKMKLKYDIVRIFASGDDVCLLCNIMMGGKEIFACCWYTVKYNRLASLKVIFDPRPVL